MTEPTDAALLADLRALWEEHDPPPADLADHIIAALAIEDLDREWELLSLVADAGLGAVRGDADTLTLQFSDGSTSVLVHVTAAEDGLRRVDGWVDGLAVSAELLQGDRRWSETPNSSGRFAFTGVPAGLCRLHLVLQRPDGSRRDYRTPQFET